MFRTVSSRLRGIFVFLSGRSGYRPLSLAFLCRERKCHVSARDTGFLWIKFGARIGKFLSVAAQELAVIGRHWRRGGISCGKRTRRIAKWGWVDAPRDLWIMLWICLIAAVLCWPVGWLRTHPPMIVIYMCTMLLKKWQYQ